MAPGAPATTEDGKGGREGSGRPDSTRERLRQRRHVKAPNPPAKHATVGERIRGYADALVFAYILAMFIRSYVFELFMIPTGSMTPTLIGDQEREVAFVDYDLDGVEDVVYTFARRSPAAADTLQVFLMNEDRTVRDLVFVTDVSLGLVEQLLRESPARRDMIVVNKFAYWFNEPDRGDIAVFKVPYSTRSAPRWEIDKPVYIKRVVGLPGEEVSVRPVQTVVVGPGDPMRYSDRFGGVEFHVVDSPVRLDGDPAEAAVFGNIKHFPISRSSGPIPRPDDPTNTETVGPDAVLMLGDNAASSLDGRYWGEVPLNHLRGKAVLRYWPLSAFGFLDTNRTEPERGPNYLRASAGSI